MKATQWKDIPWHGRFLYSITTWAIRNIPAYRYAMNWGVAIMALKDELPTLRLRGTDCHEGESSEVEEK